MKNSIANYLCLGLVIISFSLRFWGINDISSYRGDELMRTQSAETYHRTGHANPEGYYHPNLKHIVLNWGIRLFGNNPYGWRMPNVIFGTLSVALLFFLGLELFSNIKIAFVAALLLAFDPLHILGSRSTFEEIPAVFLFLMGLTFLITYLKGQDGSLLLAGLFLGLAISTKWYYLPDCIALALFAVLYKAAEGGWKWMRTVDILSAFILLPISVYLLVEYAWFQRGYGLIEFVQTQIDAYRDLQLLRAEGYNPILATSTASWEWFIKPIMFVRSFKVSETVSRNILFINNPPVWLFTIPAIAYNAYVVWRSKKYLSLSVVTPLVFLLTYLQFLIVRRPIFLYSALSCVPLSFLAISVMVVSLVDKIGNPKPVYATILAVFILWSLYLYPLETARPVPDLLYAPLLHFAAGSPFR